MKRAVLYYKRLNKRTKADMVKSVVLGLLWNKI